MARDDRIDRREFLAKSAAVTAAAAVLAACGNGQFGPNSGPCSNADLIPADGAKTIKVGDYADLANSTGKLVQVGTYRAVKRTSAGFAAYSVICTHQCCTAAVARSGSEVDCPCHGNVVNGPATRSLAQLTTHYDAVTDQLSIS